MVVGALALPLKARRLAAASDRCSVGCPALRLPGRPGQQHALVPVTARASQASGTLGAQERLLGSQTRAASCCPCTLGLEQMGGQDKPLGHGGDGGRLRRAGAWPLRGVQGA